MLFRLKRHLPNEKQVTFARNFLIPTFLIKLRNLINILLLPEKSHRGGMKLPRKWYSVTIFIRRPLWRSGQGHSVT